MRMAKDAKKAYIRDTRGSALVSVMLVLLVLLVLGLGILLLSTANTKQAKVDNTYERDYYVADGNAKQAVEVLKSAALEKYRLIAADLADNIQSSNNAASFFAFLDAVTYAPPQPDGSAGGPNAASVTISRTVVSAATHRYTVLSIATDGTTPRSIRGSIDITFVPVKANAAFTPLGSETILCGGTFRQNSGWSEVWGTVKFGAFSSYNPGQFRLNDMNQSDTSRWIVPNTKDFLNWSMKYPGFTDSVRTPSSQLSLPPIANGTAITNASFKDPPYNWNVPSPIYLEGQAGASFTISSFQYKGGQVYSTGNLGFYHDVLGTSSSYVNIYCKGNLSFNGSIVKYARIFCGGNLTINGGAGFDHVTIYCNGSITDSCTDRRNVRFYCKAYTMNGGNFIGDNILYAENSIHLESTVSGLFYTNGDIDLGSGSGLTGQMAAKGNIKVNGSFNFRPDSAMLDRLNADPFVTSSPGSGAAEAITQPPNSQIFTNTPVFSEQ
jgi:hypothetical protein